VRLITHQTVMLILVSVTLAAAGRASAAPDPKAVARAKLIEGARLLSSGEYEDALASFQQAYEQVPSPKIFYNYGLALRGLGRNAEAITAFDQFLAEARDAANDKRADAERRRAELLKKVTTLEISSEIEGADIMIDGTSYGQTPRTKPIYLDGGNHLLSVRKGSSQHVQRLTAERGQKQTVVVALTTTPPPLTVTPAAGPAPALFPTPTSQAPDQPEPAEPARGSALRVAAWSTAAGAAILLTGGVIELVVASNKLDTFHNTLASDGSGRSCGTDRANYGGGACASLREDWSQARTLGIVGLAGGGALAAASVVLFVMSSDGGERKVACAPAIGTWGVSCAGRF
jgi:hypothetical protein